MKTIIVFETIDELIKGFNKNREVYDDFPVIPYNVKLKNTSDGTLYFIGEYADTIQLASLNLRDLYYRLMELQGIRYEQE